MSRDCSSCSYCNDCRYCRDCRDSSKKNAEKIIIHKIENIHQKVLDSASKTDCSLIIGEWQTCETTHCRAEWVIFLAGEEGKKLEDHLGTPLAAAKIYEESSKIEVHWPLRFFESNEVAMADMRQCAELEKKQGEVKSEN